MDKLLTCEHCKKSFCSSSNVKRHIRKFHPGIIDPVKVKIQINMARCPLCEHTSSKSQLIDHIESCHNIKIEEETLKFDSFEDFEVWKENIERTTKSSFFKNGGSYFGKNCTTSKFECNRSGMYKSVSKGERHVKHQGSIKINSHCPAGIKLTQKGRECEVQYIKTHVGHENDLGKLFLSKSDRNMIASKLASKVPMDAILDEIRDNLGSGNLERIDLLTRKDLYNIQRAKRLNSTGIRHKSKAISLEAWVNEVKNTGCVLLYKPQSQFLDTYPTLKEEDFMLIIMNEEQYEILKEYSLDCICVDSTHGLNAYGFELHSLLVLNELRESFPCCFCISNRSDEEAMKVFFSVVRDKLDYTIEPRVFMSDMADYYYDAWTAIMEKADSRLYCTWHVDRTWRENLSKISSKETQSIIYKQLRTMMQETNEKIFKRMLESVLTSISNQPETKTFYDYFMKNYSNNTNNWAYCYRVQNGLTTNMHIEQMHRSIKYLFLDGKHTKRLDKAITAITKFCRDKLLDQLVIMNKGRLCSKISSIRTRHKISESLNFEDIVSVGGGWQVVSTSTEYYIHEENNACKCNIMCSNCGICLHRYSCSCLDSTIKWNMCKHIHLLGRYLKTFSADGEHVNTDVLYEPETETKAHVLGESSFATESPLNRICPPSMKDPFIASKKQVHDMLLHTESLLEKCKTVSQLDVIKNALRPIETTLNALECKKECIDPDEEYMLT